jgi:hypothetical protein
MNAVFYHEAVRSPRVGMDSMQVMIRNMAQLVRIAHDVNCNDLVVLDLPAIAKPLRKRGWGLESLVPVERALGVKLIRTASVGSWGPGWSLCRVAASAVPIPQRPKLSSCSRVPHHVAPRTSSPSMPLR